MTTATSVCSCAEISAIAPRSAREIERDKLFKGTSNNIWRHPTTSWPPRFQAARAVAANRIEACSCTTRRRVQEPALVLQVAARAGAAKWIATLLSATGCTLFSLALTALQAAAQALTFVPLGPMTWILLSCIVTAIGAFGATHGRPLAPHLLASHACRTRCAQSAVCFSGLVGRSVFEPASRQQSGARPSGASQSGPLAVVLIIAGLGSCAADLSAPAPTQSSQPPAAPNLPKAVPVEMLAGTMGRGPSVGKLPSADVSRIVLHGRHLNQVFVRLASNLTLPPTLFNHYTPLLNCKGGKGGNKGGSCGEGKGKMGQSCEPSPSPLPPPYDAGVQSSRTAISPRSTSPVVWIGNSDDFEAVTADGSMSSDSGKDDEWNRRLLGGEGEGPPRKGKKGEGPPRFLLQPRRKLKHTAGEGEGGKGGSCGNGKGKKGESCEPWECINGKLNGKGSDYNGNVAQTATGKTCKSWSDVEDRSGFKYAFCEYGLTGADKK